jgi:putative hydrolase of the HAD superfamily
MSDAILSDLFGVIARNQSPAGKQALTAVAEVPAAAFWEVYWGLRDPYDRGAVSSAEYWRQVATDLDTAFDDDRIAALISADIASWSSVDEHVVALLEQSAAAGTRLALLSNIPEDLAAHYERHHGRWLRHFELLAFSCRTGLTKPDPQAFLWCCDKLGLPPDRLLFIDDRAENVQAAQRLGFPTHLFTGEPGDSAVWRR